MKKVLAILLSLLLLCGIAFADGSEVYANTREFTDLLDVYELTYDLYPHDPENEEDMLIIQIGDSETYGNQEFAFFITGEKMSAYVFDVIEFDESVRAEALEACNSANYNSWCCVFYADKDNCVNLSTGAFACEGFGDICVRMLIEMEETLGNNFEYFAGLAK